MHVLQLPRPAPACAVCTMLSGRRLPRATAVAGAVLALSRAPGASAPSASGLSRVGLHELLDKI